MPAEIPAPPFAGATTWVINGMTSDATMMWPGVAQVIRLFASGGFFAK